MRKGEAPLSSYSDKKLANEFYLNHHDKYSRTGIGEDYYREFYIKNISDPNEVYEDGDVEDFYLNKEYDKNLGTYRELKHLIVKPYNDYEEFHMGYRLLPVTEEILNNEEYHGHVSTPIKISPESKSPRKKSPVRKIFLDEE